MMEQHEQLEQTNGADALMYMWPPTCHFLPTKQLPVDKRDKLSDSNDYHLTSGEGNHSSEGGLIIIITACLNFLLPNLNSNLIFSAKPTAHVPT